MFIIKKISDNSLHLWSNTRKDDFIKYLAINLETTNSDIEVFQLPDSAINQLEMNRALKVSSENNIISLEVYESINVDEVKQSIEYVNLIMSYPTRLVDSMPYDAEGNYVELEEFIPQP